MVPPVGRLKTMMRTGPASRSLVVAAVCLLLTLTLSARTTGRAQQASASSPPLSFNRDIRPILSNNCFACHGPDEKQRETKFHFDTRDAMFLEEGVIVPGSAAKSLLVKKINEPNPEDRMPPPDSGHALTDKQKALLTRWIDEGAKWDSHWSFTAPVHTEPPAPKQAGWVRNPIDQFIAARLDREGLRPSPEADKVTLLRRVTYDLTGLPPTPAEIDAFVADRSPDAYDKRVDALLASPHYGERMAMPWLDAARYADTHGYHIDSLRGMWHWRDWVISAFNRNLPFDRFVVEQLAGDLLPEATPEQKIASGFNRNHMINFEGGAIAEEYQVEYVIDRVESTSSAFMGLTMGCARCHTHKFDPITHKEFYQFFAFFNSVPEQGLDGRTGNAAPVLPLPSPAQKAQLDALNEAIGVRDAAIADKVVAPLQQAWETRFAETVPPIDGNGPVAHYELDGSFSDISGRYRHGRTIAGEPTFDVGQIGRAASWDGDVEVSFGNVGAFERTEPFSVALWLRGRGNLPMAALQKFSGADKRNGYEWFFDDIALVDIQRWAARLNIRLVGDTPADTLHLRTRERLTLGDWYHLGLTYDGKGKAAGLHLYLNGRDLDVEVVRDALAGSIRSDDAAHRRQPVAGLAVPRQPRRLPHLRSGAHRRRSRAAGAALPCARHPVWRDRQALPRRSAVPARLLPDIRRSGGDAHRPHGSAEAARGTCGTAEGHSNRDGHGGDEDAARHVRAGAGRLPQPGRKGPAGRAGHAAAAARGRTAQPPRPWPAGSSTRSIRSPRAWPSTGSGRPISATASSRRRRTSACRARRRSIPSCSTGWPPSSSAPAGTSRRCSA